MKKNLLAVLFGALVTLALPPVYIFPFAIIGFCGFFLMILAEGTAKAAFKLGWWFGFGHFTTGLYWIAFALLVDAESFWWLIPFAVFGIPAVIAFYTAIVALLTWYAARRVQGWRLVVVFACIWTAIEMLRGWLFTGFPWNLAGYIWTVSDHMLQFASIAGIWGLSLVTVLVFTMPVIMFDSICKIRKPISLCKMLPVILSFSLLACIFIGGGVRLSYAHTEFVPGVKLRLIQANIPQNLKWNEEWRQQSVQKYFDMTTSAGFGEITHVIWPETALPVVLAKDAPVLGMIAQIVPANGAIIAGALRAEYTASHALKNMFNSLVVITKDAQLFSYYDKSHLVPFGEYVPFRSILPLTKITEGFADLAEGSGASTITAPGIGAFSGLVCYEVIFPGKIIDKNNRPSVIINVTNDAWYGKTAGPYQHFQMARTRAVEEGIPLVRSANDGISAVIDAYGRIINKTELAKTAVLDSDLPAPISGVTIYGRYGNLVIILSMVFLLLISCRYSIFHNDSQIFLL